MKKIINGKVYDTATAKELASWSNVPDYGDFHHFTETLFQKKTGEFFLHGAGGPMSKYAKSCGQNQWSGGSEIIPISYQAAQKWAEEHLDGDDYETIFGEVVEDDTKISVTFRLAASTVETIKRKAAEAGLGLSEYLEMILAR